MSLKLKHSLNNLTKGGWVDSTERNDTAESISHEGLALKVYLVDAAEPIEGDNLWFLVALEDYSPQCCLLSTENPEDVVESVAKLMSDEVATAKRIAVMKAERGE